MKYFFRRRGPVLNRIVLVESGPREIFEKLLPYLYPHCPEIDLVTCYVGAPPGFDVTAAISTRLPIIKARKGGRGSTQSCVLAGMQGSGSSAPISRS